MNEALHFPQRNFGDGVNLDLDAAEQQGLHRGARGRDGRGEGLLIGRIETGEVLQVGEVAGAFDHVGERTSGLIKDKPDVLQREFRFRLNRPGHRLSCFKIQRALPADVQPAVAIHASGNMRAAGLAVEFQDASFHLRKSVGEIIPLPLSGKDHSEFRMRGINS